MIYLYHCMICDKKFEIVQKMNDKHTAYHCGIEARRIFTSPYTNRDQAWKFTTTVFGDKPVHIHSYKQYKRLLKQHGMVDASPRECLSIKPPSEKDHKIRIRQFAKKLTEKIYKKGAMDYVLGKVG